MMLMIVRLHASDLALLLAAIDDDSGGRFELYAALVPGRNSADLCPPTPLSALSARKLAHRTAQL
jgi:hypothetical protein